MLGGMHDNYYAAFKPGEHSGAFVWTLAETYERAELNSVVYYIETKLLATFRKDQENKAWRGVHLIEEDFLG